MADKRRLTFEKLKNTDFAFPFDINDAACTGMSLRDWFATHCPDSWVEQSLPSTVGEIRDALIASGIIPKNREAVNSWDSYTGDELQRLRVKLRWDYADAMLAARKAGEA